LDESAAEWAAKWQVAKAIKKEAEAIEQAAKNVLTSAIKDATFGELPRVEDPEELLVTTKREILQAMSKLEATLPVKYSWKWQERKAYQVAASECRVLRGHTK